ncbi:phosphomannomutase [Pseudodesulfovibrio senegalensis]|uniref:phosphomannomutase n=1 Tax=Pseudodesulfovibrio senegalensis TaxID=1721087 RepID=UPI0019D57664|nr:phosphomannomutase [Pseudodesulfovibrio senegalensis]
MPSEESCFKANDIRGQYPDPLHEDMARRIGSAYARVLRPQTVVVGRDMRLSSPALSRSVAEGLAAAGANVVDIGLCGTEEVYFATSHGGFDGGVMITASHNPAEYNGMKFVGPDARPIHGENGLADIRDHALSGDAFRADSPGTVIQQSFREAYVRHVLGYVDTESLAPLKIACNAGNGCASLALDALRPHLPFSFVTMHHQPDGSFPNGVPNPLLPHNREETAALVREHGCDMGVAWDGDFDRCFFFDETGMFVEGYYLVALIARAMLAKSPGSAIVYEPRLVWNTREVVRACGGRAVQSRTGHAFIKEIMRREDAAYGGEMSGHHYFRDFAYCDSGMIPWLLVAELIGREGRPLSAMVREYAARYPVSGEINFRADPDTVLAAALEKYGDEALSVDRTDGIGLEFEDWRFNLRASNTEPLVRLNVETRGDAVLMAEKTSELSELVKR